MSSLAKVQKTRDIKKSLNVKVAREHISLIKRIWLFRDYNYQNENSNWTINEG